MAIYKKGDSYYVDVWYGRGETHERFREKAGRSLREAQKAEASIRAKIAAGDFSFLQKPTESIGFHDFCDRYLEKHSDIHKAPRTRIRDRLTVAHLKRYFRNAPIQSTTPEQINGWIQCRMISGKMDENAPRRRKGRPPGFRPIAPSTINRELGTLKNIFRIAEEWGYCQSNPTRFVRKLREREMEDRYLTPEEAQALLRACEQSLTAELPAFVTLGIHTGMRRGELLNLRWDQIDFTNRTISVVQEKTGYKKAVPLDNAALDCLRSFKGRLREAGQESSPFLFKNRSGVPYSDLKKGFKAALRRAGITRPFSVKDLRHTCATWLRMKGVDISHIKDILGHRNIQTTMRYAHIGKADLARSVQVLDTLWTPEASVDTSAQSAENATSQSGR